MPRRKSYRKRYNKSRRTRKISKMRKMKTRKLTRGGVGGLVEYGTVEGNAPMLYGAYTGMSRAARGLQFISYPEVIELRNWIKRFKEYLDTVYFLNTWEAWFWTVYYGTNKEEWSNITETKMEFSMNIFKDKLKDESQDFKAIGQEILAKFNKQGSKMSKLSTYDLYYKTDIEPSIYKLGSMDSYKTMLTNFQNILITSNKWIKALDILKNSELWKTVSSLNDGKGNYKNKNYHDFLIPVNMIGYPTVAALSAERDNGKREEIVWLGGRINEYQFHETVPKFLRSLNVILEKGIKRFASKLKDKSKDQAPASQYQEPQEQTTQEQTAQEQTAQEQTTQEQTAQDQEPTQYQEQQEQTAQDQEPQEQTAQELAPETKPEEVEEEQQVPEETREIEANTEEEAQQESSPEQVEEEVSKGGKYLRGNMRKKYTKKRRSQRRKM